jgi:hypothetical protein
LDFFMAALGMGKTIPKCWPGENPPLPLDIYARGMSRVRAASGCRFPGPPAYAYGEVVDEIKDLVQTML